MKKAMSLVLVLLLTMTVCGAFAEGVAIKDEHPTLKVLMNSVSYDPNDIIETKVVEEVTGYHVEYSTLPSDAAQRDTAVLMAVANQEDYDLIQCTNATFTALRDQGMLMPLNEYIDALAPEFWDCVPSGAWNGVSDEDGNVYAFSKLYTLQREICSNLVFRMDLLKAAGIEALPTTLNEFHDLLKALKDFYGDQYIIWSGPYIKNNVGQNMGIPLNISGAFGIYNDWMVDENGKVIYYTEHPNFPALIEFMTTLYNEGLVDIDYAANKFGDVDEKFASGKAIIASCSRETISEVYAAIKDINVTLDDIAFVGPLFGEDGTCIYQETSQYSSYWCVPVYAKNAADVVNWIKEKVANQQIINLGEEGVHFQWDETGYPIPIQPAFTDERNKSSAFVMFAEMTSFAKLFSARLRKNDAIWKEYTSSTLAFNEQHADRWVPAYFAFCSYNDYTSYNATLQNDLTVFLQQLVTGVKTMDSLETFKKDFENNEGETVRAALQKWYDTYYK